MEKNTLKLLGKALRESFPIKDFRENKSQRRLVVQIERRERERDRQGNVGPRRSH